MPTELDSLEIKLTSDANKATDAVDSLTDSLKRLKSASEGLSGKSATSFLTGLADVGKKNTVASDLGKSVQSMADAEVKALSTVSDAATKSQVNINNASVATDAWRQDMQEVLGIAKTLVSPFVSLAKWSGKIVFKGLAKSAQLALSPIKKLISSTKNLFRSIARIAMYRAIRTFIKLITDGLKEGIDAMYSWSKEMGGQFAASMDTIATKTHYIGRSLAAMLAPLINLAAVVIERVTPAFVGMINVFNKFLATLTGQDYFTVAIEGLVEYGDTISGAADKSGRAAKEIRDAVVGIDELNIISQNTGSGSDNTVDGGTFVDEFLNENDKSGFAAQLAEAIGEQDWTKVGTTIAEKINDIFTDKTKIKNLSKKVGTFIKGALNLVSGLLGKVDFAGIGSSIAGFLNGIFEDFDDRDAYNLGQTLANAITALPKAAVGFMTDLNWKEVGSKLGTTLGGALSGIAQFITETDWGSLAKGLGEGLAALITNEDLLAGIANLATGLASALITATNSALDGFSTGVLNAMTRDPDTGEGLYEGDKWTTFVRDYGSKDIERHNNADFEKWLKEHGHSKGSYSAVFTKHPNGYSNLYGLYTQYWNETQGKSGSSSAKNWVEPWLASMGFSDDTLDEYMSDRAVNGVQSYYDGMSTKMVELLPTGQEKWEKWHQDLLNGTNMDDEGEKLAKAAVDSFAKGLGSIKPADSKAIQTNFEGVIGNIDVSGTFKGKGKKAVEGFNKGIADNKDTTIAIVKKWMQSAGNAASMVNLEGSPSKLYAQKAKNVILGFNNEIARDGYTTENTVANWMRNVQAAVPTLTYSTDIDPSVLNKYASGSLDTTVSTQTSLVATGFEESMERFYMTYLMPVLNQIALDTTTTANKPDPVIELDGRTLAKAVNNQNRVNGYSFS